MNDEIKKILEYLKNNTFIPDETKRKYKILHRDEVKRLLDYITNLQKTNKNHSKKIIELGDKLTNLQQDIKNYVDIVLYQRKTIDNLQQENEYLKLSNPEMNIEHFRIINENKRKINNLRKQNKKLQQENERLKEQLNENKVIVEYAIKPSFTTRKLKDYKTRCEKAVEFIKERQETTDIDDVINTDILLNILQNGSDSQ